MWGYSAGSMALVLLVAACGGDESLSADEEAWCVENTDIVDAVAEDLGLLDLS